MTDPWMGTAVEFDGVYVRENGINAWTLDVDVAG